MSDCGFWNGSIQAVRFCRPHEVNMELAMKNYSDKEIVPQNLFRHRIAGEMSGLKSNIELLMDEISCRPEIGAIELAPDYSIIDAINNMRIIVSDLSREQKEFIEFLNTKF